MILIPVDFLLQIMLHISLQESTSEGVLTQLGSSA